MSKKEKEFDFESFKEKASELVFDLMSEVPGEWKAYCAEFLMVETAIEGGSSLYEGIGLLDHSKVEFTEAWEDMMSQGEDECDGDCENCERNNENKIGLN